MAINQDRFKAIISGRRTEWWAGCARALLRMASLGYGLVVRVRSAMYDRRLLQSRRTDAVVLSVGNLTTGGTGKTPLVVWLCRHVRNKQLRCAILTRGYKTQKGELSDEPALLASQCRDVPVIVNPDRVMGATEAIRSQGAQVLIMDDGFQHRRLARDLDIVAIDATLPFGYGRVLPAGLLREPLAGLRRAHAVVLTRCDQVPEDVLSKIEEEARSVNRNLVIARSVHAPVGIRTTEDTEIPLKKMCGMRVFAFCGIGNPQAFFRTVERLGAVLAGARAFDDHHRYTPDDLRAVHDQAREQRASLVLTTQKDWTKAVRSPMPEGDPPLAYLRIDLRITSGEELLTSLIDRVLDGRIPF
jgi:tetraacyldisaccharide 4'-kinase